MSEDARGVYAALRPFSGCIYKDSQPPKILLSLQIPKENLRTPIKLFTKLRHPYAPTTTMHRTTLFAILTTIFALGANANPLDLVSRQLDIQELCGLCAIDVAEGTTCSFGNCFPQCCACGGTCCAPDWIGCMPSPKSSKRPSVGS